MAVLPDMVSWLETHELPCMFKSIFHTECPGCGIQRSLIGLLRGDIGLSLRAYPALLPIILLFIFLVIDRKFVFKYSRVIINSWLACIFAIILVSYIYKLT